MPIKQILAVLSLSMALANAQKGGLDYGTTETRLAPRSLQKENRVALEMYQSGGTKSTAGHLLATGGLALSVIGSLTSSSPFQLIGNLSNGVGIPLLGV